MEQHPRPDIQVNIAIAQQIKQDLFTEPDVTAHLQDTSVWRLTYMTSHKITGDELQITWHKDDPRSRRVIPEGLSLPAIMIDTKGTDDTKRHVTPSGVLSTYSTSTGEEEYLTFTEYWFDMEGEARRVTTTYLMEGEKPGTEEVQTVTDIHPGVESTPLDPGDYELVEGTLGKIKNGEYDNGEYGGDISK